MMLVSLLPVTAAASATASGTFERTDAIRKVAGVEAVVLENRYEPAVASVSETADPSMATSSAMIGSSAAYLSGYTGAGTRIAIIDTGLDTDHQSFDAGAFDYALSQLDGSARLMTAADIADHLEQLHVAKKFGASDLYVSSKVPFGYNYVDGNLTIDHDHDSQGEHGSHVAGIAAANSYIPGEDGYVSTLESVKVQGVAPEAQLLVMKVFGAAGGAYDSDYMADIGSKQVVDGAVAMSVKDGLYDYVICYPYNPGDQYMMAAMDADYPTYRSGVHFVAGYTYRFEMYDNGSYDSARLTITKGAQPADEVKEAAIRFVAGECVRYLALHHTYPDGEPRTIACISRDISQRYITCL